MLDATSLRLLLEARTRGHTVATVSARCPTPGRGFEGPGGWGPASPCPARPESPNTPVWLPARREARRPRRRERPTSSRSRARPRSGRPRSTITVVASSAFARLERLRAARRSCRHRITVRTERLGVRGEVERQRRRGATSSPSSTERAVLAVAVLRAEAVRAERARERADRVEAVVVDEHDRQLQPLLDAVTSSPEQHQVGAVADQHVDLALGRGHLHAEPAGDLVAHARVAVLDVVALRVARAPELVQVAGHRARGADDDVGRRRRRR